MSHISSLLLKFAASKTTTTPSTSTDLPPRPSRFTLLGLPLTQLLQKYDTQCLNLVYNNVTQYHYYTPFYHTARARSAPPSKIDDDDILIVNPLSPPPHLNSRPLHYPFVRLTFTDCLSWGIGASYWQWDVELDVLKMAKNRVIDSLVIEQLMAWSGMDLKMDKTCYHSHFMFLDFVIPQICIDVESTRFLAPLSPMIDTLLPFSSENEVKVYNHGVLASRASDSQNIERCLLPTTLLSILRMLFPL
ncbi:hypothetical protein Tco_1125142 [Tanacetum coccineum]|uniref:Uncharacterized protein n=1 Tax=Tanacetum coccineum TaxID=301880 RepID=A0ABQ5J862_9ASTR